MYLLLCLFFFCDFPKNWPVQNKILSAPYSAHLCLLQKAILHKMLKLEFWNFQPVSQNVVFIGCNILFQAMVICFSWYVHLKECFVRFHNISHSISGDKSIRVLCLHIWNQLPETTKAKWTLQIFKRSLSHWLGPNCK